MADLTTLHKKELEMRRIETVLVTIRYTHVDYFLDFNVTVRLSHRLTL